MARLFVLDLEYIVDAAEVARHLPAHREYLARHYADGTFLASGRKVPRTGGVIVARGTRATIDAAVEADPFHEHGVAHCVVTEFEPTMTAEALSDFR